MRARVRAWARVRVRVRVRVRACVCGCNMREGSARKRRIARASEASVFATSSAWIGNAPTQSGVSIISAVAGSVASARMSSVSA